MKRILTALTLTACFATGAYTAELTPEERDMLAGVVSDCHQYGIIADVQDDAALEDIGIFRSYAKQVGSEAACEEMLRRYPNQVHRKEVVAKDTMPTGGPMAGNMAKYNIAARILNNTTCDSRIFDMSEAARLQKEAQDDFDRSAAFQRGVSDAINNENDREFCEKLQIDAGSWSMVIEGLRAPKELRDELKLMSEVELNNCNWNGQTGSEFNPPRYGILARRDVITQAGIRAIEIQSMYGFTQEITAITASNDALGDHPAIDKLCDKLETYAKGIKIGDVAAKETAAREAYESANPTTSTEAVKP